MENRLGEGNVILSEINETKLIEFYKECQRNKLTDFDLEFTKEKAKIIAKKYGVLRTEIPIDELYKYAEKIDIRMRNKIEKDKLKEIIVKEKIKERELYEYSVRISKLKGVEKPLYYLKKELEEITKAKKKLDGLPTDYMRAMSVKEKDWSIAGGIADGLAGPAAGLATALDVQRQNLEIRKYNDSVARMAAEIGLASANESTYYSSRIKTLSKKINDLETVYISKETSVIQHLNFNNLQINETITGKIKLETDCWIKPNSIQGFPENNRPLVDGTIFAEIRGVEDNKVYANINLVIGKDGLNEGEICKLNGIDIKSVKLNKRQNYHVIFSINSNLFIMESNKNKIDNYDVIQLESKKKNETEQYWKNNQDKYEEITNKIKAIDMNLAFIEGRKKEENHSGLKYIQDYENQLSILKEKMSLKKNNSVEEKYKYLIKKVKEMKNEFNVIKENYNAFYNRYRKEYLILIMKLNSPLNIAEVKYNE